jgi:hypothetical protein
MAEVGTSFTNQKSILQELSANELLSIPLLFTDCSLHFNNLSTKQSYESKAIPIKGGGGL